MEFRKEFRASAAGVTKALLSVAELVDQGQIAVFSKKLSFAYHPSDKVAIELVRRNSVCV